MNKKTVASYVFVGLAFFIVGMAVMLPVTQNKSWFVDLGINLKSEDRMFNVEVEVRRFEDGKYSDWQTQEIHNIVVNTGLKRVIQLLYGNASAPTNATSAISLSNDATPLATWTKLANEKGAATGLTRAAGTLASTTFSSYTSAKTFTAAQDTQTVQTAGLHWGLGSLSDNCMLAAASFTQVTLNTNDQIAITWTVSAASA